MNQRKTYSKEFKREAVRLLEESDQSPNEIAAELGIRRNMLYKWQEQLNKQGENAFRGPGRKPIDELNEVARLRRELARVKEENAILKKAAAYFAKELP